MLKSGDRFIMSYCHWLVCSNFYLTHLLFVYVLPKTLSFHMYKIAMLGYYYGMDGLFEVTLLDFIRMCVFLRFSKIHNMDEFCQMDGDLTYVRIVFLFLDMLAACHHYCLRFQRLIIIRFGVSFTNVHGLSYITPLNNAAMECLKILHLCSFQQRGMRQCNHFCFQ